MNGFIWLLLCIGVAVSVSLSTTYMKERNSSWTSGSYGNFFRTPPRSSSSPSSSSSSSIEASVLRIILRWLSIAHSFVFDLILVFMFIYGSFKPTYPTLRSLYCTISNIYQKKLFCLFVFAILIIRANCILKWITLVPNKT